MRNKLYSCSIIVIGMLFGPMATQATPIVQTFEGLANAEYNSPITRLGYNIGNVVGDLQHFHEIDSTAFPGFVLSNGTGVLYNDRNSRIFVELFGGGSFQAGNVDVSSTGPSDISGGATNITVTGFLNNLSVGSIMSAIDFTSYSTFSLAGLGLVDRIEFAANGNGGFSFDNLNLDDQAVPAPATLALFSLGLAGLGWSRRKKA